MAPVGGERLGSGSLLGLGSGGGPGPGLGPVKVRVRYYLVVLTTNRALTVNKIY